MDVDLDRADTSDDVSAFSGITFRFLEGLAANNNKTWFDENRKVYETKVRNPFAALLNRCTKHLSDSALPLKGSSDTMYRINRDLRFTKDKRPYSEHVSGILTPSGRKEEIGGLVYIHLDATGGFVASGFYKPGASELKPLRETMLKKPDAFRDMLDDLKAASLELSMDDTLTAMPRGFSDAADHDLAPYIKLKSFILKEDLPKSAWMSGAVVDRICALAEGAAPLLTFGRKAGLKL